MTKPSVPSRPEEINGMSDRQLIEAVYRGIYGEEPIHPGLAKRVARLEMVILVVVLVLVGAGLIQIGPELIDELARAQT